MGRRIKSSKPQKSQTTLPFDMKAFIVWRMSKGETATRLQAALEWEYCRKICQRIEEADKELDKARCDKCPQVPHDEETIRQVYKDYLNASPQDQQDLDAKGRQLQGLPAQVSDVADAQVLANAKMHHFAGICDRLEKLIQQYESSIDYRELGAALYRALGEGILPWETDKETALFDVRNEWLDSETSQEYRERVLFEKWIEEAPLFQEAADYHFPKIKSLYLEWREAAIEQFVNYEPPPEGTIYNIRGNQEPWDALRRAIEQAIEKGTFPGRCGLCP